MGGSTAPVCTQMHRFAPRENLPTVQTSAKYNTFEKSGAKEYEWVQTNRVFKKGFFSDLTLFRQMISF